MNIVFKIICCISLSLLLVNRALAESVFVKDTVAVGLEKSAEKSESEIVTTLVSNAVTESGIYPRALAWKDAQILLQPKLMKLGQAYILTLSREKNGIIDFSSSLRAETFDEMDKIALRLTQAVLQGINVNETVRIDNVTANEAIAGTEKKASRQSQIFTMGPVFFNGFPSDGVGTHLGIAKFWDADFGAIRFNILDFNSRGSVQWIKTGIGANYVFNRNNFSPYLGGEFNVGILKTGDIDLLDEDKTKSPMSFEFAGSINSRAILCPRFVGGVRFGNTNVVVGYARFAFGHFLACRYCVLMKQ